MNTKDYLYMKDHEHFQTEDQSIDYLEGHDTYVKHLSQAGYHCSPQWKMASGIRFIRKRDLRNGTPVGTGGCQYFLSDIVKMEDSIMKNGI